MMAFYWSFGPKPRRPARSDGKLCNLQVCAVGGKGANILQIDQLPPTRQNGRNDHGNDSSLVDIDPDARRRSGSVRSCAYSDPNRIEDFLVKQA